MKKLTVRKWLWAFAATSLIAGAAQAYSKVTQQLVNNFISYTCPNAPVGSGEFYAENTGYDSYYRDVDCDGLAEGFLINQSDDSQYMFCINYETYGFSSCEATTAEELENRRDVYMHWVRGYN